MLTDVHFPHPCVQAKRRDLISNRIQNKLRSETSTALEISSKEREMKTIRVEADKKEAELALRSDSVSHACQPAFSSTTPCLSRLTR
jgi:hypothetical protein